MKYNLPTSAVHKVTVSGTRKHWLVDGFAVAEASETFLWGILRSRVLYDGAISVRHTGDRYRSLRKLVRAGRGPGPLGHVIRSGDPAQYEPEFNDILDELL